MHVCALSQTTRLTYSPLCCTCRRLGLALLVARVLGKRMEKSLAARISDWTAKELRDEQLQYAALDAWASWELGLRVLNTEDPQLNAATVAAGLKVDIVVDRRVIASGTVAADTEWCGLSVLTRARVLTRAVVEVTDVKVPAALVPFKPRQQHEPTNWPHALQPGQKKATLADVRAACPPQITSFKLLVNIANLYRSAT